MLIYADHNAPQTESIRCRTGNRASEGEAFEGAIMPCFEPVSSLSYPHDGGREKRAGRMLFAIRAGQAGRRPHRGGSRSALTLLTTPSACRGVPPIPHP